MTTSALAAVPAAALFLITGCGVPEEVKLAGSSDGLTLREGRLRALVPAAASAGSLRVLEPTLDTEARACSQGGGQARTCVRGGLTAQGRSER
jgi:hypothetical protein